MSVQPITDREPEPAYPPLRIVPAPQVDPPALETATVQDLFAEQETRTRRCGRSFVQSTLAIDFRECGEDPVFGPQATQRVHLPEPSAWARQLIAAVLECMAGARPVGQLARWLDTEPRELVARRHRLAIRRDGRPLQRSTILKVHVCEPVDGVAEAAVVVHHDGRVRAIAARLSGVDGRWLMTALQIG